MYFNHRRTRSTNKRKLPQHKVACNLITIANSISTYVQNLLAWSKENTWFDLLSSTLLLAFNQQWLSNYFLFKSTQRHLDLFFFLPPITVTQLFSYLVSVYFFCSPPRSLKASHLAGSDVFFLLRIAPHFISWSQYHNVMCSLFISWDIPGKSQSGFPRDEAVAVRASGSKKGKEYLQKEFAPSAFWLLNVWYNFFVYVSDSIFSIKNVSAFSKREY